MKRISRIVTLPDYQGIGIGTTFLNAICEMYIKDYRVSITTTTPALINSFRRSSKWALKRQGRSAVGSKSKSKIEIAKKLKGSDSTNRITTSWEYRKDVIIAVKEL